MKIKKEKKVSKKNISSEEVSETVSEAEDSLLRDTLSKIQDLYSENKIDEAEKLLGETLKTKFSIDIEELRNKVALYVKDNAANLAEKLAYIVPEGDWSKCLNGDDVKQHFLTNELSNPKKWLIHSFGQSHLDKIWSVVFEPNSVETPDGLSGIVYVSETGKIKHVFVQAE